MTVEAVGSRVGKPAGAAAGTVLPILTALSASHFLNDLIQSLLPSVYPILKQDLALSFAEIGLITFVFQVTASLLQPVVGIVTDRRPQPASLAIGMACSLAGLLLLSGAHSLWVVLAAAATIGIGSSIFHPEASRVARMAAGGRFGFAQSFFQVGGNTGQAVGPLLAALIVVPFGQRAIAWFGAAAILGMVLLIYVGRWYAHHLGARRAASVAVAPSDTQAVDRHRHPARARLLQELLHGKPVVVLHVLSHRAVRSVDPELRRSICSCSWRGRGRHLLRRPARRPFRARGVIWVSIVGVLPFSLALPYTGSRHGRPYGRHRLRDGVGLPRHRGLCAGARCPDASA